MSRSIAFTRLPEADPVAIVRLMNDPLVRRQMPLTDDGFDVAAATAWVADKEALWAEYGFGPWAIWIDGRFAGWGGVQPEGDEADLALVLHPDFWGTGKAVFQRIIDLAFGEIGLASIVIYFPPTRTRVRGILRAGFVREGEHDLYGETFVRYRLMAPA